MIGFFGESSAKPAGELMQFLLLGADTPVP
jgi:hypothetical protein